MGLASILLFTWTTLAVGQEAKKIDDKVLKAAGRSPTFHPPVHGILEPFWRVQMSKDRLLLSKIVVGAFMDTPKAKSRKLTQYSVKRPPV